MKIRYDPAVDVSVQELNDLYEASPIEPGEIEVTLENLEKLWALLFTGPCHGQEDSPLLFRHAVVVDERLPDATDAEN